jgi:hypothetical protein
VHNPCYKLNALLTVTPVVSDTSKASHLLNHHIHDDPASALLGSNADVSMEFPCICTA